MRQQAQKSFWIILLEFHSIKNDDIVFDESFSSKLVYTSQPYSEAMAMCPSMIYTPCATSPMKKTGDIVTFTQFEEGNLLSETRNNSESGNEYDDDSIIKPLISEE